MSVNISLSKYQLPDHMTVFVVAITADAMLKMSVSVISPISSSVPRKIFRV
jgi:hypothetical protein